LIVIGDSATVGGFERRELLATYRPIGERTKESLLIETCGPTTPAEGFFSLIHRSRHQITVRLTTPRHRSFGIIDSHHQPHTHTHTTQISKYTHMRIPQIPNFPFKDKR
jgi:hypothetical protein